MRIELALVILLGCGGKTAPPPPKMENTAPPPTVHADWQTLLIIVETERSAVPHRELVARMQAALDHCAP